MSERRFTVEINNKILGNSSREMTLDEISRFNVVALMLAKRCVVHGGDHSSGMFTVREASHE